MYFQHGEAHYTTKDELEFIHYLRERRNLTALTNLLTLVPYRIWHSHGLEIDPAAVALALKNAITAIQAGRV